VIALFLLTSGSLKNFSLNMIVGIVEGTYSTFISSFIVLEWTKMMDRRHKKREMDKYGIGSAAEPLQQKTAEMDAVEVEAEVEGDDEGEPEGLVPEPVGLSGTVPGAPSPDAGQPMLVPAGQQVPAAQPAAPQPVAAQQAQRAPGNVMSFPGQSGSRHH
jgi:hypothetical protein